MGPAGGRVERLPGRRRQAKKRAACLLHELLRRLLAERFRQAITVSAWSGKIVSGCGIIRLEHEHVIAKMSITALGQLDALGEVDAAEDAPHLGVLERVCFNAGDTEPRT